MKKTWKGMLATALLLLITACAAPPKKKELNVFFPPAPELPRVQYLASFAGLKDIEEQSSFNKFVVGEKQNRRLDKPYGVGIYDGKIYVCDTNDSVIVFDLKAKTYGAMSGAAGQGKLVEPLNISIEPDGTKYVTDPGRGQVVVFDARDQYVRAYGIPGNWKPVDSVTFADRLYVVDNQNGVVKVFDKVSGAEVKAIGNTGTDRLNRPTNIAFDSAGMMYITDFSRFQVVKYDRDGHFLGTVGSLGDSVSHFARPKGLATDREGRLYVVDAAFNNVQMFNKDGRLLLNFGQGGEGPGDFLLPAKVTVDYDNVPYFQKYAGSDFQIEYLILVVNQFGDQGVSVLGFGKQRGKKYPNDDELLKQIEQKKRQELQQQQKQP